ncbi:MULTISPECIES: KAP family P-loop NTPase fold protein [unclassified Butyrivibrio]|uniref:KAP family P-loop NTPase fold protein n=1 Tax=unclassified Butyrivibrio TaxID=2639466 RepID=UPI000401C667|nr:MULTISPECIES: P-loop NTPase fold protein [unclassified Butyrivibrio]SEL21383.1 KAP family P-loop domain-containing protein [Butyrivibrio sp. ob235]
MKKSNIGFTDVASVEDLFDIGQYTKGLTEFISACRTPMTISIQGAWGTGKTTVMNIVRDSLKQCDDIQMIWFNTWQFSQFHMDDELALSFLEYLCSELELSESDKDEISRLTQGFRKVTSASKEILLSIVDSQLGGRIADNLERGLSGGEKNFNPIEAMRNMRERFESYIQETLIKREKSRIVIFIDDLDRLEPRRAVELLEVLKLFLDCPNCVFILAIDYDVVVSGVEAKYGFDDEDKGKNFFDKIIQVPFRLPVANYNITRYVKNCLEEIGIQSDDNELSNCENLIECSIGANPRAIKRLFNAYLLLRYITPKSLWDNTATRNLLFATLCLQYADENLYNIIIRQISGLEMNDIRALATEEIVPDVFSEFIDEEELKQWRPFFQVFVSLIDGSAGNDEERIKLLHETTALSTVTASGEKDSKMQGEKVLDHNMEKVKVLGATDVKYKICVLGTNFNIGLGQYVKVEYNGKIYNAKMHNSIKGRVDRLGALFSDNDLHEGDRIHVFYDYAEGHLLFEKITEE